jgi:uncharacterized membrane protein
MFAVYLFTVLICLLIVASGIHAQDHLPEEEHTLTFQKVLVSIFISCLPILNIMLFYWAIVETMKKEKK